LKITLVALTGVLSQQPGPQFGSFLSCQINPNTPVAERACTCHYLVCTSTGDCSCGWDEMTQSCKAGIPTTCTACPIMRRCGTDQPLLLGADGFPVAQDVGWGRGPFLQGDEGHAVLAQAQTMPKIPLPPAPVVPINLAASFTPQTPLYVHGTTTSQVPPFPSATSNNQYSAVASWQAPSWSASMPAWNPPMTSGIAWQTYPAQSWQTPAMTPAWPAPPASTSFLYNNRAPTIIGGQVQCHVAPDTPNRACACHYLACNLNAQCACGWDDSTQTCRAGVSTTCTACPTMHRCGDIVL
jgi:hypothetical protein